MILSIKAVEQAMRIIAGQARGRRIETLKGEDTRPTLERVKEGMFSAIQFWLPGARVLDLYAGSGQLGLEALSRGAKSCVFVDDAARAVEVVNKNVESLGFAPQGRAVRSDAALFLARCDDRFDLVFADPPYHGNVLPGLLGKIEAVCAPGALVLCESEPKAALPECCGRLHREKQYRYGTVMVSRYKCSDEETE